MAGWMRCQRMAAAGLVSQTVHSGRYPCWLQNGADSWINRRVMQQRDGNARCLSFAMQFRR